MRRSDLVALVAGGHNSGVEFNGNDVRPEQLAREVVALANVQSWCIPLGGGGRLGHQEHTARPSRTLGDGRHVGQAVHPMMLPFCEGAPIEYPRHVAVITVSQGETKPYVVRYCGPEGTCVRVGSASRLTSGEQQVHLFAVGGLIHAELLPVPGGVRDLSGEAHNSVDTEFEATDDYLRLTLLRRRTE